MGSPTTNYGWMKPTIGGDSSTWGSELNTDLDGIDSTMFGMLPKAGGTMTGNLTMSGAVLNEINGADIASAATINLTTATGNYVQVTGTTTITAVTLAVGARRVVKFTGALTLTNNAAIILPGGANIPTSAGDTAEFWGVSTGVICVQYTYADGHAILATKLSTARTIAMTGDVTWTSPAFDGSGNVTAAGTIANGAVTGTKTAANTMANSNLAQMAGNTFKANNTGSTANAADITVAQALTLLGFVTSGVAANGSITLPGGLIIKWGDAGAVSGGNSATVTFGTAFPNNIWSVVALAVYSSGNQGTFNGNTPSTTGFTFKNTGSPATTNSYWIAIGD